MESKDKIFGDKFKDKVRFDYKKGEKGVPQERWNFTLVANRLIDYENTDLSPEEIIEMKKNNSLSPDELKEQIQQLQSKYALLEAEKVEEHKELRAAKQQINGMREKNKALEKKIEKLQETENNN